MTKRKARRERGKVRTVAKAPVQKYKLVMSAGRVGRRDLFAEYVYVANAWLERLAYGLTATVHA